jgi:hypothetical protein
MEGTLPVSALSRLAFGGACAAVIALEALALAGWQGWRPAHGPQVASATVTQARVQLAVAPVPAPGPAPVHAAVALTIGEPPAVSTQAPVLPQSGPKYYAQLRRRIHWVPIRFGDEILSTPDMPSRMLLVKSAARQAGLQDVGLGFKDVYGIISAETSWVPRTGASKDGTPNLGIAQFEPATARLLGMRNPDDPVESVHVAALHMREAALWSQERIAGLKLDAQQRAEKLREGVSIYYNLSSRGRSAWNGRNTRKLPRETQLHIYNARLGAREADLLDTELQPAQDGGREGGMMMTASSGQGAVRR